MGELRLVVNVVDLSAVFGESGERDDVVQIDLEGGVDVVNEGFDVLFGSCEGVSSDARGPCGMQLTTVEWDDDQL